MRAVRVLHAALRWSKRVGRSLSWLALVPAAVRQRLSGSGRTVGPAGARAALLDPMASAAAARLPAQEPEPGEPDGREASVGEGGNKRLRLVV